MPEARSTFDASLLLHDGDCDILHEYSTVVDGALDMRRKFALVVSHARQLQAELLAKQAEVDHLTAQHRQKLSEQQSSAEIARNQLRTQGHRLQKYRNANKVLRCLAGDLETTRKDLDQVDYLRCNICTDSIKNAVTKCGHGFCRECLTEWLRWGSVAGGPGKRCPVCRRIVRECEIQDIYLEPDRTTSAVLEDDEATEILSVDSDSE